MAWPSARHWFACGRRLGKKAWYIGTLRRVARGHGGGSFDAVIAPLLGTFAPSACRAEPFGERNYFSRVRRDADGAVAGDFYTFLHLALEILSLFSSTSSGAPPPVSRTSRVVKRRSRLGRWPRAAPIFELVRKGILLAVRSAPTRLVAASRPARRAAARRDAGGAADLRVSVLLNIVLNEPLHQALWRGGRRARHLDLGPRGDARRALAVSLRRVRLSRKPKPDIENDQADYESRGANWRFRNHIHHDLRDLGKAFRAAGPRALAALAVGHRIEAVSYTITEGYAVMRRDMLASMARRSL